MKFPSLFTTLSLLKPKKQHKPKVANNDDTGLTLYDKIEEMVSIASFDSRNLQIVVKFYELTEIQQQLTLVTFVEHNMSETLSLILESNFDTNFLIRGQTPLHFAIKDQNLNMIKTLIKHKADLELKDIFKETALNCAVRTGNIDVISYLLEQGALVNTQASDSSTPLEFAIHNGDSKSVEILKHYGAHLGNSYLVKNL